MTSEDAGQPELDALVRLLDLEQIDADIFRGQSHQTPIQRVFGGQVAGQALVAAGRTVAPERSVHSLHSYFIRAGDANKSIVYEVDRVRDGRSFSVRRVVAVQDGKAIFTLSASFQLEQEGIEHQPAMPAVPMPEDLPTLEERYAARPDIYEQLMLRNHPIERRYVDGPSWDRGPADQAGTQSLWIRANGKLPDDPLLHVCVLTYASDLTLLDTVLVAHGLSHETHRISMASLDHAMWFLRPFRMDEWILYSMKSPAAHGGRGFATGRFFSRDGVHLGSVAQEGMIRVR
ncbi:MAG TPA: acyl-CoA thioesterase II [Jatrophihabitans sp.]|jgi:acyl-CoA thioesterase-2